MSVRPIWRALVPLAARVAFVGLAGAAQASTTQAAAAKAKPKGTKIIVANTVPSAGAGRRLRPVQEFHAVLHHLRPRATALGCTPGVTKTPVGPITCTGPSNDKNAEWPAITTKGRPVAGPGVSPGCSAGLPQGCRQADHLRRPPAVPVRPEPGAVTGEGWFEPGLPPWHGVWWLISPGGHPVPWAGSLTTTKVGGKTVLAAQQPDRGRVDQLPPVHLHRRLAQLQRLRGHRGLRPRLAAGGSPAARPAGPGLQA